LKIKQKTSNIDTIKSIILNEPKRISINRGPPQGDVKQKNLNDSPKGPGTLIIKSRRSNTSPNINNLKQAFEKENNVSDPSKGKRDSIKMSSPSNFKDRPLLKKATRYLDPLTVIVGRNYIHL
jgi:hypothetical protein